MARALICAVALCLGAFAQTEEPGVVVNLDGFRYPPIARVAGIQGNVVFRVSVNGRELISSTNPLLTAAAADNLKTWLLPTGQGEHYVVTYHLQIIDAGKDLHPIGSRTGRFFRRLVGARTDRIVNHCFRWDEPPDPAPRFATGDSKIDVFAEVMPRCGFID